MSEEEEKKTRETNDVYENISNSLDTSFDGEELPEEVKELVEEKMIDNGDNFSKKTRGIFG